MTKIYEYPSKSSPLNAPYKTTIFDDGTGVCECRGFRQWNHCWHLDDAKSKPLGRNDPRISLSDKIAIKEQVAEGSEESAFEKAFSIFPSMTRDECVDLVEQICGEEFE